MASQTDSRELTKIGLSAPLAAGTHTVLLAGSFSSGGNVQSWGVAQRRVAAIEVAD